MMTALAMATVISSVTCLNTGVWTILTATIVGKVNDNPGGHAPFPYTAAHLDKPICVNDAQTGKPLIVDELVIEPSASLAEPSSMIGRTVEIEGTVVLERYGPGAPPVPSLRDPKLS